MEADVIFFKTIKKYIDKIYNNNLLLVFITITPINSY